VDVGDVGVELHHLVEKIFNERNRFGITGADSERLLRDFSEKDKFWNLILKCNVLLMLNP
jgi:hypothetical protein